MKSLTPCGLMLLLATTSAHAGVVFYDDFGTTSPDPTLTANLGSWSTNVLGPGLTFNPIADANNWFGNGVTNGVLKIEDTNTASNGSLAKTATFTQSIDYGIISFDLYEPSTSPSGANTWVRINFAGRRVELIDGDTIPQGGAAGSTKEYALDTKASVAIYFNTGSTTQTISTQSVASGQMLVFVDGSLKITGSGLTLAPISSLSISTNTTATTELYMDNFQVAIPEPASASLLAAGLALMFYRRR